MTIFEYKFYFIFNLKIQSNNLGIFRLNDNRLLRLKVDNVNKAAALTKNAYGPNTSSALKYNGSNAAPYSMKSKYYDPRCC